MIAVYFHPLHTLAEGDDAFNNSCFDCTQYSEMAPAVTDKHIPVPGFHKAGNLAPSLLQQFLLLFQDSGQIHRQAWPPWPRLPFASLNRVILLNCKTAAVSHPERVKSTSFRCFCLAKLFNGMIVFCSTGPKGQHRLWGTGWRVPKLCFLRIRCEIRRLPVEQWKPVTHLSRSCQIWLEVLHQHSLQMISSAPLSLSKPDCEHHSLAAFIN